MLSTSLNLVYLQSKTRIQFVRSNAVFKSGLVWKLGRWSDSQSVSLRNLPFWVLARAQLPSFRPGVRSPRRSQLQFLEVSELGISSALKWIYVVEISVNVTIECRSFLNRFPHGWLVYPTIICKNILYIDELSVIPLVTSAKQLEQQLQNAAFRDTKRNRNSIAIHIKSSTTRVQERWIS